MVFIQSHICPTSHSMLDAKGWVTTLVAIDRQDQGQEWNECTMLTNSLDFSSFYNYKLHLHYEQL